MMALWQDMVCSIGIGFSAHSGGLLLCSLQGVISYFAGWLASIGTYGVLTAESMTYVLGTPWQYGQILRSLVGC